MTDIAAAPFHLDSSSQDWVEQTLARLTPDEKLRQLFNLRAGSNDPEQLAKMQAFRPGSITRTPLPNPEDELALIAEFNAAAPVPLLISADLEGSRMSLPGGIEVLNPLGLAAVDDIEVTTWISAIMAAEARAYGINWSFTPVLDVNAAFRSAIVATRGFGSDVDRIERHAIAQLKAFQELGVASAIKHWPGEGFDDRDQHLVTTINPLSMEDWERIFGRLYRAGIAAGALSVMSAHIALPAYVLTQDPAAGVDAFRPASISPLLNNQLLREELGFNGLIVSDATSMAGHGSWGHRAQTLPELISSGCDVILFTVDADTDLGYIRAAVEDGRLSWARVDDAVRNQLALKAAVGLHRPIGTLPARDHEADEAFAIAATQRAPTLVKDVQGLLPIDPQKHRRVLIFSSGIIFPFVDQPLPFQLPQLLRDRGFEVTLYDPAAGIEPTAFDLHLWLFGDETLLTRGHIFLEWRKMMGDFVRAMRRYWHEVPTAMISFGYPYMLYDAPRVPTYINAYTTMDSMQEAVVEALLGKMPWNRQSPVDAFCGLGDARY